MVQRRAPAYLACAIGTTQMLQIKLIDSTSPNFISRMSEPVRRVAKLTPPALAWPMVVTMTVDEGGPNAAIEADRQRTSTTDGVEPAERFSYFREAVCQAFMNLTPEPPDHAPFSVRLDNIPLGRGALNRVVFPQHVVCRSLRDIAASDRRCFYLNLKLAGRCSITQSGHEIALSPGQVGLFDSDRVFALRHGPGSTLGVASFRVPAEKLLYRLPSGFNGAPVRLYDDPHVGQLIVKTAHTLNASIFRMKEDETAQVFEMLLDLVAIGLSRSQRTGIREAMSVADAVMLSVRHAIDAQLRKPGLRVADVAAAARLSERYVHILFSRTGTSFADHVMRRRLDAIAADLRDPSHRSRAIGDIAFDWGFADLSHFARRFKQRFGMRAGDWRHLDG
jgi:AraC family transcriptional activator of tynA and feaB